jgi:Pentapeptide repeats (8 copies)
LASWRQAVQSLPSQVSQVSGINLGFGNIGSFNLGGGNTGNTNVGSGNTVQRRARG